MVRRTLQSPWLEVDRTCATPQSELGAEQDVINAQPAIALEPVHAVVPPSEGFVRLSKHPEAVLQSQGKELPEGLALLGAAQDLAFPGLGIVNVFIGGWEFVVRPARPPPGFFFFFSPRAAENRKPNNVLL